MDSFDKHSLRLQLETIVIGIEEEIKIKGIGTFDAKVDSGNGGYNVIHGEDVFQQGDVVTFTTLTKEGEKQVSKRIRKFVQINIGSGNIEERPVIALDVEIGGNVYKNIPFSIANRTNNEQKVLICKSFVKNKLKALIDVGKKHISDQKIKVNYITEAQAKKAEEIIQKAKEGIHQQATPPRQLEQEKEQNKKQNQPIGFGLTPMSSVSYAQTLNQAHQNKQANKSAQRASKDERANNTAQAANTEQNDPTAEKRKADQKAARKREWREKFRRAWHETGRYGDAILDARVEDIDVERSAQGDKLLIQREMNKKGMGSQFGLSTIESNDLLIYPFIDALGNYYDGTTAASCEQQDALKFYQHKGETPSQNQQNQNGVQPNSQNTNQQAQQKPGQPTQQKQASVQQTAPQAANNTQANPAAEQEESPIYEAVTPNQQNVGNQQQQQNNTANTNNNNQQQVNQNQQQNQQKPSGDPDVDRVLTMYASRQNFKCYFVEVGKDIMNKASSHDANIKSINKQNNFPSIVNNFFQAYRQVKPSFQPSIGDVNIRDKFAVPVHRIYSKLDDKIRPSGTFAMCWGTTSNRQVAVWENLVITGVGGNEEETAEGKEEEKTEAGVGLKQEYDGYREKWIANPILKYQMLSLGDNGTDLDKLYDMISTEMQKLPQEEANKEQKPAQPTTQTTSKTPVKPIAQGNTSQPTTPKPSQPQQTQQEQPQAAQTQEQTPSQTEEKPSGEKTDDLSQLENEGKPTENKELKNMYKDEEKTEEIPSNNQSDEDLNEVENEGNPKENDELQKIYGDENSQEEIPSSNQSDEDLKSLEDEGIHKENEELRKAHEGENDEFKLHHRNSDEEIEKNLKQLKDEHKNRGKNKDLAAIYGDET